MEGMNLLFVLSLLCKAACVWFALVAVAGLVCRARQGRRPRYSPAAPRTRFAVLAAGRNEEAVISGFVRSILAQDYPRELFDVYVLPNNCTDFFSDLKFAAILHNGANCDPLALLPGDALSMATVNGAEALGRDTGVIAPGKTADLILVDFTAPNLTPCHDAVENLVYAARGCNVEMNMARGRVIYEKGEFYTLDLERIRYETERYALPHLFGR